MRYTVGVEKYHKETRKICRGIFAFSSYGLPFILSDKNFIELKNRKKQLIDVLDSIKKDIADEKISDDDIISFLEEKTTSALKEKPFINKDSKDYIAVFTNINEVETYCQSLSRQYRRDDVWTDSSKKSEKIIRFYPLKIDSSNFEYLIEKEDDLKFSKEQFFYTNRFGEKQKTPQGSYYFYKIVGTK